MAPDYTSYDPIDFVLDDQFIRYALSPDAESEAFWASWVNENPHKKAAFEEALHLVEAVKLGLTDYSRIHLSEEKEKQLLYRIQRTNVEANIAVSGVTPLLPWLKGWRVAVAILLLCGIGAWFVNYALDRSSESYETELSGVSGPLIEKANHTDSAISYYLPDSTEVILFPDSRLIYSGEFGQYHERKVVLVGKARFSVTRNPELPFLVVSDEITTKVLGTVFEVNAFGKEKDVTVKVITGKVSVFKNRAAPNSLGDDTAIEGVLLAPNQQVTYSKGADKFDKKLVNNPEILDPESVDSFYYEETPVSEVLKDIEKSYGIPIIYDTETLKGCQLNASLSDESLADKLQIICTSVGVQYEFVEGSIVITGKGCQNR